MATTKKALITGVTGQDGAYLAELLLSKGYEVHGVRRRASSYNTHRVDKFLDRSFPSSDKFVLHYGDMIDATNLIRLLQEIRPDEIYNLAAQSHVHISFDTPEYTADVDALGTLRLLEAMRVLGMNDHCRYYQASTSELYGRSPAPQNEETPFRPCSPYATAKLYAYWSVINYREAYNMHASNGILFNHESPLRGEAFVTRKITRAVAAIKSGLQDQLSLGNLNALRDWGHARDFVYGMWLMLQQDKPDDYVLATGKAHTVREFTQMVFEAAGYKIRWEGEGLEEKGINDKTGEILVTINPKYFRPNEVNHLCGDFSKANKKLGWAPKTDIKSLIAEMFEHDLQYWAGKNSND